MKKTRIFGLIVALVLVVTLAACGSNGAKEDKKAKDNVLKIGASNIPHAVILEHVKPILEKEGIDLQITTYQDYILPNKALADGEIDANYFQHIPYFNLQVKENNYDFVNAGAIHIEPLGLYSKRVKNLADLKDGATVIVSNSTTDWGRVISILQDAGLVKVKDGVDITTASFDDIVENKKNLKFTYEADPALMTTFLNNDEGDIVAINSNFAVDNGLDPLKDAIALEKTSSPYANIVAVRKEDKDNENIKKLVEVLKSKDVKEWILKEWNGAVVPVD
ncbi:MULTISPECIES: MetQ/NlpA family ABC transporter substrate-binding protein [Carnobacterium]|uniref:MetQ/NlpA family ABC transporter substrate-binding protein n=1 Tax=Carnobacterium TaxID=2747 RepID=UPI00191BB59A|nr:MetQ/NlpA family ABC transporter substrate-binding protein [Carnobacterium maltaromaticum]CAD5897671.1 methionine ABC transporter, substrate binding lipoprotein [Carnobacterium maltaromaticum]